MSMQVVCGFMPLVDAAPLVVAREMGFAREEGLQLELRREPSWSTLRDRLSIGALDFAHMLAPVPVSVALGLGGLPEPLGVPFVLSVNGNVIGVTSAIAERLPRFERLDAYAAGRALKDNVDGVLRIGVPFPFSMHVALLEYWLAAVGADTALKVRIKTVPPPLMAEAIAHGEVDAFCVGEPWGSVIVEHGIGEILMPTCAIWAFAPEKVLAARQEFLDGQPDVVCAMTRALWRSAQWLSVGESRGTASELLSAPAYLDRPAELIERSLAGELVVSQTGETLRVPRMMEFHRGAANFPWRSQALWIARQLAARNNLDLKEAMGRVRTCFRPDLYRTALDPLEVDLPGASEKVEGALADETAVASNKGTLSLGPDRFFDGRFFDPTADF